MGLLVRVGKCVDALGGHSVTSKPEAVPWLDGNVMRTFHGVTSPLHFLSHPNILLSLPISAEPRGGRPVAFQERQGYSCLRRLAERASVGA